MFRDNWLVNYANIQGIQKVLNGMSRRAKFKTDMDLAIEELEMYYESFDAEFTAFFEELITFSHEKIQTL
jgi:acyl carrier protein phosphodiesterase